MSVSQLLDPTTGKVSEQYLPSSAVVLPSAGSATPSAPSIPSASLWSLTLPNSAPAGTSLLLSVNLNFTLTPSAPFVGADIQPTLALFSQSGTHTLPFPTAVPFLEPTIPLVYPDGTALGINSYSITAQTIVVSDGSSTWSIGATATSPAHTYTFAMTRGVATLTPLA